MITFGLYNEVQLYIYYLYILHEGSGCTQILISVQDISSSAFIPLSFPYIYIFFFFLMNLVKWQYDIVCAL